MEVCRVGARCTHNQDDNNSRSDSSSAYRGGLSSLVN